MARKIVVRRGRKVGAPPGTLVHIGKSYTGATPVRVIDYDQDDTGRRIGNFLAKTAMALSLFATPDQQLCWG